LRSSVCSQPRAKMPALAKQTATAVRSIFIANRCARDGPAERKLFGPSGAVLGVRAVVPSTTESCAGPEGANAHVVHFNSLPFDERTSPCDLSRSASSVRCARVSASLSLASMSRTRARRRGR
jgi:hypothetical protein